MLNKIILPVSLILLAFIFSVFAQKTVVKDLPAKTMLLGKHKLSLQWISWDYFGTATITNKGGVLFLKGEQRQKGGDDYLKINGKITLIEKTSFTFFGKIETSASKRMPAETGNSPPWVPMAHEQAQPHSGHMVSFVEELSQVCSWVASV